MVKLIQGLLGLTTELMSKAKVELSFERALNLNEAGQYKEAFPLMREAAEAGNMRAMCLLGSMYLMGRGTGENGTEAERWLKLAMEKGFTEAGSVLGMAYATGKAGIKRDIPLGRKLLSRAAASGEQRSARMLEMMDRKQGKFGDKH